jgi:hypothetical protein
MMVRTLSVVCIMTRVMLSVDLHSILAVPCVYAEPPSYFNVDVQAKPENNYQKTLTSAHSSFSIPCSTLLWGSSIIALRSLVQAASELPCWRNSSGAWVRSLHWDLVAHLSGFAMTPCPC